MVDQFFPSSENFDSFRFLFVALQFTQNNFDSVEPDLPPSSKLKNHSAPFRDHFTISLDAFNEDVPSSLQGHDPLLLIAVVFLKEASDKNIPLSYGVETASLLLCTLLRNKFS